jgi:hypothetical protein
MMKFFIFNWKGIVGALVVAGLCFSILRFSNPIFFLSSIVLWIAVVALLFRSRLSDSSMWWNFGLLILVYIATLLLMSLTEWIPVTRVIILLAAVSIGSFVAIIESEHEETPVYIKKAFRRIFVMGWVFVCGAFLITTYAISVFFPNIPVWLLFLSVGVYTSIISYAVWRMYYPISIRRFSLWLLIMAVMNMEIFWAVHLLPFGYIVLGFIATWIWYMILLFIRFHMSVEGVRWKEQIRFLIGNGILFVLLLFVIRWI